MDNITEEDLKNVFNELKNNDEDRDFITFYDFESAIRLHNI